MRITCDYKEFADLVRWCNLTKLLEDGCDNCPFLRPCQRGCKGIIPSIDEADIDFCIPYGTEVKR